MWVKRLAKYAMWITVAFICAVINDLWPNHISQLILYLMVIWRIEATDCCCKECK